ncbi:MAG TPA: DUF1828 domain-containing protein [candidate division Zixibacteria bacterium]|nr:DUF1828 domain-containing protein [candidate division Zixibacteria bacterium]
MRTNIDELQKRLCKSFCANIKVSKKNDTLIRIETPFSFPDGDPYQIYMTEIGTGGYRITDMGHTLMQLSYENDIDLLRKGTRGNLLGQIQLELGIKEDDGEFFLESTSDEIHNNLFKLGQAITKIYDLTYLNRARVENTFYEDLEERLYNIVDAEKIIQDYVYSAMENADDYPIDYMIKGKKEPLFLFGIGNRDKARLTTIILERLIRHNAEFESLIVFHDFDAIPKNDAKRLMNVAGEMISSLDAKDDLSRKILKRVA